MEQIPGVGVNIEKFRKKPELRELKRKELDIPPNGFHIVSVGELVENKNHAVVIEQLPGYTMKTFITVSVAKALQGNIRTSDPETSSGKAGQTVRLSQ